LSSLSRPLVRPAALLATVVVASLWPLLLSPDGLLLHLGHTVYTIPEPSVTMAISVILGFQ
jgi:hypothetical protein